MVSFRAPQVIHLAWFFSLYKPCTLFVHLLSALTGIWSIWKISAPIRSRTEMLKLVSSIRMLSIGAERTETNLRPRWRCRLVIWRLWWDHRRFGEKTSDTLSPADPTFARNRSWLFLGKFYSGLLFTYEQSFAGSAKTCSVRLLVLIVGRREWT